MSAQQAVTRVEKAIRSGHGKIEDAEAAKAADAAAKDQAEQALVEVLCVHLGIQVPEAEDDA